MKDAREICAGAAREQTGLDFSAFANQLLPGGPEPLLDVLTHPDRGLADDFVPDLGTLGALVTFKASTALWSLSFHRKLVFAGAKKMVLRIDFSRHDLVGSVATEASTRRRSENRPSPMLPAARMTRLLGERCTGSRNGGRCV